MNVGYTVISFSCSEPMKIICILVYMDEKRYHSGILKNTQTLKLTIYKKSKLQRSYHCRARCGLSIGGKTMKYIWNNFCFEFKCMGNVGMVNFCINSDTNYFWRLSSIFIFPIETFDNAGFFVWTELKVLAHLHIPDMFSVSSVWWCCSTESVPILSYLFVASLMW